MIRVLALIAALACLAPALAAPPKLPAGADPENTILFPCELQQPAPESHGSGIRSAIQRHHDGA